MRKVLSCLLLVSVVAMVLSCGGDDPIAPIEDSAPTAITLSQESASLGVQGSDLALTVTAPTRPVVTGAPTWVTVVDGTYNKYNITYTFKVAENTSYEPRTATLTIASGSLSKTVTISQAAAEKPEEKPDDPEEKPDEPGGEVTISTSLVTQNATDAAKALYGYILSQYGKKIISSIMADVNWNHREADKVHSATGKYPAMNCYDFIHIYVPEGNNWINYSDLKPVTEWAEAGGIVSLMWHFNVPKSASVTPGLDGSGVTCTPSETTFRAKNVFTKDTWENKWFYEQMDKVAAVILALQEKGIAAVWRPFHEAAGNATYKQQASWTTSWFWWGYDGAETYKKLWTTMFDYLASKGIRNLIWVWTTQNYNGDPSKYNQDSAWYPGDKYVDVVARDLYGTTAAANATEFNQIQKAYHSKMVALGECGADASSKTAFASIPSVWSAGAKWSWFMPWYGANMPDTAWWKTAMSSSNVITRSDVKY